MDPYIRGTAMAQQFLKVQLTAGRTADQIAATHDYITGPWREAGHHSAAQAETYRGYTDVIAQQLTQLREAEPTPAPRTADRPLEHAEVEAGQ